MAQKVVKARWTWLAFGILAGAAIGVFWPPQYSWATATDRHENFLIATGFVDGDHEAVYMLDHQNGLLLCTIINRQTGKFGQLYRRPIAQDFGVPPTQARYMMVTGRVTIRSEPRAQTCLYLTEVRSGQMIAYTFPWLGEQPGQAVGNLIPLDKFRFRQ